MNCVRPRLAHILFASAFALSPLAGSPALSAPASPPPPQLDPVKGESTTKDHKDMMAAQPGLCAVNAQPTAGVASDPEEGGQVSAKKVKVTDMQVTKHVDTASTKQMESATAPPNCR